MGIKDIVQDREVNNQSEKNNYFLKITSTVSVILYQQEVEVFNPSCIRYAGKVEEC
jgi:nitric oxide synthase oxygenase domain/subunit